MNTSTKRVSSSRFLLALAAGVVALAADAAHAQSQDPQPIILEPESTFLVSGFDSNDNAQIVLHGILRDSCERMGNVRTEFDGATQTLRVVGMGYRLRGVFCADVISYYTQVANLGPMRAASYRVQVGDARGGWDDVGALRVEPARTANQDDFLYAPVTEAFLDRGLDGTLVGTPQHRIVVLRGQFAMRCLRIREVRQSMGRDGKAVVLLPIVEAISQGNVRDCKEDGAPFELKVPLQYPVIGQVLLHVRSANGQAINRVEEL